jgi:hypothetical protein
MMEQALPIYEVEYDASVDDTGDISNLTAEQYMSFVRRQAKSIPSVVKAVRTNTSSPFSSSSSSSSSSSNSRVRLDVPVPEKIFRCPEEFQPDTTWENETLHAFSEQRSKISLLAQNPSNRERKVSVPKLKDEESWHEFCFRSELPPDFRSPSMSIVGGLASMNDGDESEGIEESIDDVFDEENENEDENLDDEDRASQVSSDDMLDGVAAMSGGGLNTSSIPMSMSMSMSGGSGRRDSLDRWAGPFDVDPSVSLLLQFDQVMCQRLLSYHIMWLDTFPITQNRAQWLFALLSYISKPLHRDMESDIRHLYRVTSKQLATLLDRRQLVSELDAASFYESIKDELILLNYLILVTGSYFGQSEFYRRYQDVHERTGGGGGGGIDGNTEEEDVDVVAVADDEEEENDDDEYDDEYDDDYDEGYDLEEGEEMNIESCRGKRPIDSEGGGGRSTGERSSKTKN